MARMADADDDMSCALMMLECVGDDGTMNVDEKDGPTTRTRLNVARSPSWDSKSADYANACRHA